MGRLGERSKSKLAGVAFGVRPMENLFFETFRRLWKHLGRGRDRGQNRAHTQAGGCIH